MKQSFLTRTLIYCCCLLILSCQSGRKEKSNTVPKNGMWRMEMALEKSSLPFNFELNKDSIVIHNGRESVSLTNLKYLGDSLIVSHPVFESEFRLKIVDSTLMQGFWFNYYKGEDYKIPVRAEFGKNERFTKSNNGLANKIEGKYEVLFSPKNDPSKAIGIFNQEGNKVNATFATETGDYRFLDGVISNDSLFLSTFDGSHAFLFEAKIQSDTLSGMFWSGIHWEEQWVGFKNDSAMLTNPDSLTYIIDEQSIEFSLVSTEGKQYDYPSHRFNDQVVILQIMGSWCPNCLDETHYLSALNEKFKNQPLSILSIAFERTRSEEKAIENLKSIKAVTGAKYPFLLAGFNRESNASDVFPMLNHIMSYPTTIFIDKKGKVRKIHTGFYGPGTGHYYDEFVERTEAFVKELINEI